MREIDKYNETQVRQKMAAESYEAKIKSSISSDKRYEETPKQSITLSPHKKGEHSSTAIPGNSDQSATRSLRESKDFDIKRCKNEFYFCNLSASIGTIDSEKVTIVDQKKVGAMNFLSSSSVNSSI